MPRDECPFCGDAASRSVEQDDLVFVLRDAFPVSRGHTLIVPHRHVASLFETTAAERLALFAALARARAALALELGADGFNVGINDGSAAGQTVMHLHIHLIPRFRGDVDDPRGGVRHVIPGKGNYLAAERAPLATGGLADPFLLHVQPLFRSANEIRIVAAFVQDSGLEVLRSHVLDAVERGAHLRFVTGDYLHITQVHALRRLHDWTSEALVPTTADDADDADDGDHSGGACDDGEPDTRRGSFEARVVPIASLRGRATSFHPKSWIFEAASSGAAFVGSSNVSHAALCTGVEWNLRVDRATDPRAFARVTEAFDALWAEATPLSPDWIDAYAEACRKAERALPLGDVEGEPIPEPPDPHALQATALERLAAAREEGRTRALVVMATGLGKTYVAAFDFDAFVEERGGRARLLFVAHRAEILRQAAETLRRVRRTDRFSWFAGESGDLSGDVVFASVQKLGRAAHLRALDPDRFDYVVIDEVHHAAAPTYRRVLDHLQPRFLLGLTATPDRADEADIAGLFDDHVAYRADLGVGIEAGHLVPFHYMGLCDTTDYAPIPWRNRRFDAEALAEAVQTQARMEALWKGWHAHPGTRTLVFCCSIAHAEFACGWLRDRGVEVEAVHSGPTSASRADALDKLAVGALAALCTVDLFNEGVDVPDIDRVVMLRPTESPVLFLQQLGRGLRVSRGKARLQVIDFVGNHRVFLDRVRQLLSLAPAGEHQALRALIDRQAAVELPAGCSVELELEAIALLEKLMPRQVGSELARVYRELRVARGQRPTAGELFRLGFSIESLRPSGGWLAFVDGEGDLTSAERLVSPSTRPWFDDLERTAMTKCFKMVVLEALIEADALLTGLNLDELAERSRRILERSPELAEDLVGVKALDPDPRKVSAEIWARYWRQNPIAAWLGEGRKRGERAWFVLEGDRFRPRFGDQLGSDSDAAAALASLTAELVDYRLARYRRRRQQDVVGDAFVCKVFSNQRDPILKLPSRERAALPHGDFDVRLPDGAPWRFRFAKIACNVAHPVGVQRNQLPDLLRRWFGPGAGQRGTAFAVRFEKSPDGWWIEPLGERIEVPERARVVAFPSLRAAAGAPMGALVGAPEATTIALPGVEGGEDIFAVRAAGDSMDGGSTPIRDGDWVVLRYARGESLLALENKVALVSVGDPHEGASYLLKSVTRSGRRFELTSRKLGVPPRLADASTVVIARHVATVPPERLAPREGTAIEPDDLAIAFGWSEAPRAPWSRVDGHLVILVTEPGLLVEPGRVDVHISDRQPGETAFVLTRPSPTTPWRYAGVGRWRDDAWAIPEVDYATWRALGRGRSASRVLEDRWVQAAAGEVARVIADVGPGQWIEGRGRRFRVTGRAPQGGLRIDGGPQGFRERTISLVDLGWVLCTQAHARETSGLLDEALVNRLRYLPGTPKPATRWIDTQWALALVDRERPAPS